MRAVIQRVSSASVTVDSQTVGSIETGLLVLLGIGQEDSCDDVIWMASKIAGLRIFPDEAGKMNLSLKQVQGKALVVSQFTLYGDCRKGKRPSFVQAAAPEVAQSYYQDFVAELTGHGITVETGIFQAKMDVALVNDGPVTLILDSP